MNLFAAMDISGSAMQAERMRAEVVAANMANAETTRTAAGTPYRRQHVVFAADPPGGGFLESLGSLGVPELSGSSGLSGSADALASPGSAGAGIAALRLPGAAAVAPGVHVAQVVEDTAPPLERYDPGHPDANAEGYVAYPDINPLTEMVDLMGATRAYGMNSAAVQAEKGMIVSALDIVKS